MRTLLVIASVVLLSGCLGGSAKTTSTDPATPSGPSASNGPGGAKSAPEKQLAPATGHCDAKLTDHDGFVTAFTVTPARCGQAVAKRPDGVERTDFSSFRSSVSWPSLQPTALELSAYIQWDGCQGAPCVLAGSSSSTSPITLTLDGDAFEKHADHLFVIVFSRGPTAEQPLKIEVSFEP